MSTLAIGGSSHARGGGSFELVLRLCDLGLLAVALPVFLVAGWPLAGYGVAAGAWLVQRGVELAADRRSTRELAAGNRRGALAVVAVTTLARVWLVALSILLVGLAEREAGLAAAVLTAVLVTLHLAGRFLARALHPEGG